MAVLTQEQMRKLDKCFYDVAAGADPCGWRQPVLSVWEKYQGSRKAEAMKRRYVCKEHWVTTCERMKLTTDTYFRWREEFIISAVLAGYYSGLEI